MFDKQPNPNPEDITRALQEIADYERKNIAKYKPYYSKAMRGQATSAKLMNLTPRLPKL